MYLPKDENQLIIGGKSASQIVDTYQTPLYVYDTQSIKARAAQLQSAFSNERFRLHYALKANPHPEIAALMQELGIRMEVGSLGELRVCQNQGIDVARLTYTASFVSKHEIARVLDSGVTINADSLKQLRWIGEYAPGTDVGLRINTGVGAGHHEYVKTGGEDSKFGIHPKKLEDATRIADKYDLKIVGLHHHVGSQIGDVNTFAQAMKALAAYVPQFPELDYLNLGGGLKVAHELSDTEMDLKPLADRIDAVVGDIEDRPGDLSVHLEPGRFLVADSGFLLVRVTDIKHTPSRTFVGVNSGMNHLLRPALYNAYHHIVHVDNVEPDTTEAVDIVGNVCESADVFARDRAIGPVSVGDTLAICTVGAYGQTMASSYNSRGIPESVFV